MGVQVGTGGIGVKVKVGAKGTAVGWGRGVKVGGGGGCVKVAVGGRGVKVAVGGTEVKVGEGGAAVKVKVGVKGAWATIAAGNGLAGAGAEHSGGTEVFRSKVRRKKIRFPDVCSIWLSSPSGKV